MSGFVHLKFVGDNSPIALLQVQLRTYVVVVGENWLKAHVFAFNATLFHGVTLSL